METAEYVIQQLKPYAGDSGTCNDTVALAYLNSSRSLLWNKADVPGTTAYACVSCPDYCFTAPSWVDRVTLAWLGKSPISLGNEWYQSIPSVGMLSPKDECNRKMIEIGGYHVTFQNYLFGPYNIALQAESVLDEGKELTITAIDQYGTKNTETLALGLSPIYSLSTELYKAVAIVVKDRTKGRVRMYAIDPNNGKKMLLAVYQPYDTNPSFKKYKIQGCRDCLTIFAKKKYFDIVDLTELVEFTPEAIIHAVSAIVNRENKGTDAITAYTQNLSLAIAEVNRQIANVEMDVGSAMRIFWPDQPDSINPGPGWGYGTEWDGYGGTLWRP